MVPAGFRRKRLAPWSVIVIAAAIALGACSATSATEDVDLQATVEWLLTANGPSAAPESTVTPTPPTGAPTLSFEPATYRDPSAGFEFDYPANWTVGPVEQQSRGGITAFTSWSRPTDALPGETPAGETRMDATVQLWDPTGDLNAFVTRFLDSLASLASAPANDAIGIAVMSDESLTLSDGRPAAAFVVEGSDGTQTFFFFTTLNDKYLVLSGQGDLALLAEIARTVRPIEITY